MSNLVDFSMLNTKVQKYLTDYELENSSNAFGYVLLSSYLSLSEDQIENSLTDGPNDRGIDALYVEERENNDVVVHFFQLKYTGLLHKTDNAFPSNEIGKLITVIQDIMDKNAALEQEVNPLLWERITEVWGLLEKWVPRFKLHIAGNMQTLTSTQKTRLENALAKYRYFEIVEHTLSSVVNQLIDSRRGKPDREIQIVDTQYFERSDENLRGLIATIEAKTLVQMIVDPANPTKILEEIFNDNARVWLGKANRINIMIMNSALAETNPEFWYLNNGITITCESFDYPAQSRAPKVWLEKVQIVNGGQTAHALFEAAQENPGALERVLVLTRIYETKDKTISEKIAESTNSQTPIKTRDLRSNDDIQKKLELEFKDLGFFYERKASQFSDEKRTTRIDALRAGQVLLAFYLDYPEVAKKEGGRVFSDFYDQLFNEKTTARKILLPLQLFDLLDSQKKVVQRAIKRSQPFDKKLLFLPEGLFHVLHLIRYIAQLNNVDINTTDIETLKPFIKKAITIVRQIAEKKNRRDESFSYSVHFKDADTKLAHMEKARSLIKDD